MISYLYQGKDILGDGRGSQRGGSAEERGCVSLVRSRSFWKLG
jgi:hypothetical protein